MPQWGPSQFALARVAGQDTSLRRACPDGLAVDTNHGNPEGGPSVQTLVPREASTIATASPPLQRMPLRVSRAEAGGQPGRILQDFACSCEHLTAEIIRS